MKLPTSVWRNWRLTTAKDFFVTKASLPRMTAMTDHKRSMSYTCASEEKVAEKVAKRCTRSKGILTGLKIPPVTTHAQNLPCWAGRKTNFEMLWARPNAGRGSACTSPSLRATSHHLKAVKVSPRLDTVRNSAKWFREKDVNSTGEGEAHG